MQRLGYEPTRFLMVGNSVKSEVLPVIAAGAHEVHIPYHTTWEHDAVTPAELGGRSVGTLTSIGELPEFVGTFTERNR